MLAPETNGPAQLQRNDKAMLHWMCATKPTDDISTQDLHLRLCNKDLEIALRRKHLKWFGHIQWSESWISRGSSLLVEGSKTQGWPRKSWREVLKQDLKLSGLEPGDEYNCVLWRTKTAMQCQICISVDH